MRTQKGWILFFVGILISTFLGGAVRVLLSPAFVRQWVDDIVTRSQPRFTFEFAEAKMSFGRGWVPQVAIELSDLNVRAKDPCITGAGILVSQIVVPLHLRSLMAGRVRFGNIAAERVTYVYRPRRCEGPVREQTFDMASEIAPLENFFQRRWNKEVVNTTRFLHELSVAELRFVDGDKIEPAFYLRDLNLAFFAHEKEAELKFDFWPGIEFAGDQPFGPTATVFRIGADTVKWIASGNLKEGQIHSDGHWLVDKGQYDFHIRWQDLPLTNFMELMHRWNFSSVHDLKINNEWFSCGFSSKGELRSAAANTIQTDTCEIYGDTGRARLQPLQLKPKELVGIEYTLQMQDLDVRRFSQALGYLHWSNYLAKMGTFSGEIKTKLQGSLTAEGTLANIEIYWGDFGLPSERGSIESASLKASVYTDGFSLLLNELRGRTLPRGAHVKIDNKNEITVFSLTAPTMELSTRWPLVAEVAKHVASNESVIALNDFNFSFEKSTSLDWTLSGVHAGSSWNGHGLLLEDHELRGDITVKRPKARSLVLKLTGILREPVVVGDQAP